MKSNKQRRAELKAKKASKQAIAERARKAAKSDVISDALARGVAVNCAALAPDNSYSVPDFVKRGYYVDMPFECQECGNPQIWKATQQKWWYKVAKGKVWTTAKLCRPCRQLERARREKMRRVSLEGLERKLRKNP